MADSNTISGGRLLNRICQESAIVFGVADRLYNDIPSLIEILKMEIQEQDTRSKRMAKRVSEKSNGDLLIYIG